ncbi:MAG: thiamine phosphate synthase [Alphaproteobacteria bacterium]|nr:thiamine phosphate synthase [Alphaproteobacteria bacterium]
MTFRTDGVWGFYPIVETASQVAWLLELGCRTVQLRDKVHTGGVLRHEVKAAIAAAEAVGAQLVVNDHAALAVELGARWVHLGQGDLDTADLDALRSAGIGVGISTHSPGELARALAADPAYVALGPVYATTLKRMPWAPQGLARVRAWRARVSVPLCAIGGLTPERAPATLDAGADLIAVVSDITGPDADARVAAWLELFASRRTP